MKIHITQQAAAWYIRELDLKAGDSVQFFGKVYGKDGFSFALAIMEPSRPEVEVVIDGVRFYVEKSDAWFFSEHDLDITFDEIRNEPVLDRK
ncbi:MAG: Fe-S cluster assembly protein HesB [Erysipelothrix sp.]|nr:Fe-S cluster assembly protein HesB [Erysipelothrix sp.]